MFTLCEQLNPSCGSRQVLINHALSVISGFDSKIDSCGVWGISSIKTENRDTAD
jgi:hypothetical protein